MVFGGQEMERRVYDCILFNGEFDVLAIRMRELNDVVHRFVVVESNKTFSGLGKPVKFTKHHPAIGEFSSKIDFVLVDDMPETENAWDREAWQRNAVMRGLTEALDNDLVLMSDVDEIPRIECVREVVADSQFSAFGFRMILYYFYMNYKNIRGADNIIWSVGATFKLLQTSTPDALRYGVRKGSIDARIIDNGGWHFSYLMDEKGIKEKIQSFSHQEFNKATFLNRVNLEKIIARSSDLFGRPGFEWSVVDQADLPGYVVEHKAEFQKYFASRKYLSRTATLRFRIYAILISSARCIAVPVWHFLKPGLRMPRSRG
jgi:hypothetical protein